jgi:hypothetical protein
MSPTRIAERGWQLTRWRKPVKSSTYLLILATGLLSPWAARADEIDTILTHNRNAQELMQHLADANYANVAVLKGEIQTGGPTGTITTNQGKMGELLATRLENVLILATDSEKPIGVTRGASAAARKANRDATFTTEEGRARLFQTEYPLAWGNKSVKVNAFLVPRITLDAKMQSLTVSIRYFDSADPKKWKTFELAEPTAKLSQQLLVDLDKPFSMPATFFRKRGGDGELKDEFPILLDKLEDPKPKQVDAVKPVEDVKPEPINPSPMTPNPETSGVEKALEFKVFYNDAPAAMVSPTQVKSPKNGDKVHLTLKSKERLGVVVLVNGINTADYDSANKESSGYVKWVLEPDQGYIVRGYYATGKVYPFEVASKSRAKELLNGLADSDRFGLIELLIYKEIPDAAALATTGPVLRTESKPAESLEKAKENISLSLAAAKLPTKRSFLIPGAGQAATLENAKFEGVLAAKLQIRYAE